MRTFKMSFATASLMLVIAINLASCKQKEDDLKPIDTNALEIKVLPDTLSKLKIYEGAPSNLQNNSSYIEYEGINNSYNDSCDKQDLVYVPVGKKIVPPANGNGLPTFPSGTILLKTFYYWKDKRNHSLGKQLVETRVVLYDGEKWTGKAYAWDASQNDAYFVLSGKSVPVSWINENGKAYKFDFKIASEFQCRQCHTQKTLGTFLPIHFQMKNLNLTRPWAPAINQLEFFSQKGIMSSVNSSSFLSVPAYSDTTQTIEKRVRGYLDTNCAHCHSPEGYAYDYSSLNLKFDVSLEESHILDPGMKADIISRMLSTDVKKRMPKIHSSLNDTKYINLVEKYLNTLP